MLYHCVHQLQRIQQFLVVGASLGVFHDKLPASKQCLLSLNTRSCLDGDLSFNMCICHLEHIMGQDKAPRQEFVQTQVRHSASEHITSDDASLRSDMRQPLLRGHALHALQHLFKCCSWLYIFFMMPNSPNNRASSACATQRLTHLA